MENNGYVDDKDTGRTMGNEGIDGTNDNPTTANQRSIFDKDDKPISSEKGIQFQEHDYNFVTETMDNQGFIFEGADHKTMDIDNIDVMQSIDNHGFVGDDTLLNTATDIFRERKDIRITLRPLDLARQGTF